MSLIRMRHYIKKIITKRERFVFLLLISLLIAVFNVQISFAVCCGSACYESGVCVNNVWYQGCKDKVGSVHPPETTLGKDVDGLEYGCMTCICSTSTQCEWKPNGKLCRNNPNYNRADMVCKYTITELPDDLNSECTGRDNSQQLCENPVCNTLYAMPAKWITHGEIPTGYVAQKWEYQPTDILDTATNPPTLKPIQRTPGCCGDDTSEYYITTTINSQAYGACCNATTDCVDQNYLCMNETGEELSCSDKLDNDCDGKIDEQDDDCCPNADTNNACCVFSGGVYNANPEAAQQGRCCGEVSSDNGIVAKDNNLPVKDRFLCYITADDTKAWIDLYSQLPSTGNIFTINNPIYKTFDIVKANNAFNACDSKNDGITSGNTKVGSLESIKVTKDATSHNYICYSAVLQTGDIERFAECVDGPNLVNAYSVSPPYGGERKLEGGSITNGTATKYCCTEESATKGWVNDLDAQSCVAAAESGGKIILNGQTGCEINSYIPAKSGEDKPEIPTFPLQGTTLCCGDDAGEYYIVTTINNLTTPIPDQYSACCDKQTDCVDDKGFCRNETTGEKSCSDGIDNDCDGLIDHGTVDSDGNQLTSPDPDCCGDGDQFLTCCQLKGGTWFNDNITTFCCGDDTPEYVVNSTITYPTSSYPLGPNTGTYSCCPDKDDCVYDGKCHIGAKDGAKENANNGCYDGKDNDCDSQNGVSNGASDFSEYYIDNGGNKVLAVADEDKFRANSQNEDDDCTITITGKIVGEGGEDDPVEGTHITLQGSFNSPYLAGGEPKQPKLTYEADTLSADDSEAVTDPDKVGTFTIVGVNGDSSYDITITHPDYESKTKHIEVGYDDKVLSPIKIGPDHDTCNSDCTNIGNDLCNKDCDAVFGSTSHPNCYFGGQSTDTDTRQKIAQLCHERTSGQLVNYTYEKDADGNSLFVECCKGAPETFKPSTATISAGYRQDLIRTTRIITYRGKPVKMIIDAFG